jgi:hypothetical protein
MPVTSGAGSLARRVTASESGLPSHRHRADDHRDRDGHIGMAAAGAVTVP